jgi:uncharacterized phage protein (TIGR02220 family)
MTDDKREFKGIWFPAEVWLDERLTALEKMILMEIDSLDNEDNCYASNEHLAKFCQCSQSKVSGAISKLKKLGYVRVKSFDGRKRILESCLTVSISQTNKKEKSAQQNLEERVLDETSSKNTSKDKEELPYAEIIDYLNEKTGKHFRSTTEDYRREIHARWVDESKPDVSEFVAKCRYVIDVKCAEWLGTDFDKNLNPKTLFRAANFDRYANQSMPRAKGNQTDRRSQYTEQQNAEFDLYSFSPDQIVQL